MNSPLIPISAAPVVSPPEPPPPQTLVCANCGSPLAGEYCAKCGQRHEPHVHTVTHFASEAFESITHADSRLWRTLGYLLTRPGLLTREFFDGRRARYLPPFRLYIVISVVFFLVGMPEHVSVKPERPGDVLDSKTLNIQAEQFESADNPLPEAMRKRSAEYLREEAAKAKAREDAGIKPKLTDDSEPAAKSDASAVNGAGRNNVNLSFGGLNDFCDSLKNPSGTDSAFRISLRERCQRLARGDGNTLGQVVIHNVPRAMFIFLPLLALVMMLLYWRPKRYYVEHLLFLIHNHAFVFLAATLLILAARVPFISPLMGWLGTAVSIYAIWYIYRAMRNVYGQGIGLTLTKYFALGFTYVATSVVMLVLTVLYSALTL
ncbi:MAG: DUF3667 domain-containing protein [Pseudomonadota bacterium]